MGIGAILLNVQLTEMMGKTFGNSLHEDFEQRGIKILELYQICLIRICDRNIMDQKLERNLDSKDY